VKHNTKETRRFLVKTVRCEILLRPLRHVSLVD